MKVAIFSPYLSNNYGTVLQAYALQTMLSDLGYSSDYINWRIVSNSLIKKSVFLVSHPFFFYHLRKYNAVSKKDLHYNFLCEADYKKTFYKNEEFVKRNMSINTQTYDFIELTKLEKMYDTFIVGSDQTWTPYSFYQYSPYYLSFVKERRKINSYGCSLGTNSIPKYFKSFLRKKLSRFNKISCRDRINIDSLKHITGRDITHVVDPTLLIDPIKWEKVMMPIPHLPECFILCYILGERDCVSDYAEKLSKEKGIPVYYILTRPKYNVKANCLKGVGVSEFLWLIKEAKYVVTDSFHGTIFSINLGTNFVSFDKFSGNELDNGRVKDLLDTYGLSSHFRKGNESFLIPEEIDFSVVHESIANYRKNSISYLKSIFEHVD